MREHGVLNRVLLIYDTVIQKIEGKEDFDPGIISSSAQIVQQFIEGYHERNEEQQLFPRFRQAGQLVDLVKVLYQQHQAGRRLTDTILGLVPQGASLGDAATPLVQAIRSFIAMYRPHEAREDTVLFPKLRQVVSANEFDAMAEDFERDEHQKFGQDGFHLYVEKDSKPGKAARHLRSVAIHTGLRQVPRNARERVPGRSTTWNCDIINVFLNRHYRRNRCVRQTQIFAS